MNNYRKALLSIFVALLLLVPIIPLTTSGFGIPAGADADSWYMTVEGVAHDDLYTLYPYFWDFTVAPDEREYEPHSIKVGFSQFGELINSRENAPGVGNVGLQYGEDSSGRDPFAPPWQSSVDDEMPKEVWQQGWFINITYFREEEMRNVWAMAQHADLYEYGNGWVRVDDNYTSGPPSEAEEDPTEVGYYIGSSPALYGGGGRKTNGTAVTDPIQVLYDDSRRFVAQVVTHISDFIQRGEAVSEPKLVDVIITIDFNKVKREVNVIKDVKITAPKGSIGIIPWEFFWQLPEDSEHPPFYPAGFQPAEKSSITTDDGTTTTVIDDTMWGWPDKWVNYYLLIMSGPLAGERRLITAWDPATDKFTVDPAFSDPVLDNVEYALLPNNYEELCNWEDSKAGDNDNNLPDSVATDALGELDHSEWYPCWLDEDIYGLFIQFSNRGEWDLGEPTEYKSYVHFFTMGDQAWPFDDILFPPGGTDPIYPGNPNTDGPFDDGIKEDLWTEYGWEYTLTTTLPPNAYSRHGPEPWPPVAYFGSTIDLAQVISDDGDYVGWAAFWPSLSDWSVDGHRLGQWWRSLAADDWHGTDATGEPFRSPYIIGEWDFILADVDSGVDNLGSTLPFPPGESEDEPVKIGRQFRGVTMYGVTETSGAGPEIDYCYCDFNQLFFKGEGTEEGVITEENRGHDGYSPGKDDPEQLFMALAGMWYFPYPGISQYKWLPWEHPPEWCKHDGHHSLEAPAEEGVEVDESGYGPHFDFFRQWVPVGQADDQDAGLTSWDTNIIYREVAYYLYEKFRPWDIKNSVEKSTKRVVEFGLGLDDEDEISGEELNDGTDGYAGLPDFAKIFDDDPETGYDYLHLEYTDLFPFHTYDEFGPLLGWVDDGSGNNDLDVNREIGEWFAYSTFPERVLVEIDPEERPGEMVLLQRGRDYLLVSDLNNMFFTEVNVVFIDNYDPEKPLEIPQGAKIKVLFSIDMLGAMEPASAETEEYGIEGGLGPFAGSYEWITAGRDAATVDSLGGSMITEAFDSWKDIMVEKPALDMMENPLIGLSVPYLLRNFHGTEARTSYYYDQTTGDYRLALKDDWSSTVPIASSNIITVGGPLANAVTEYFNEFEMAIYRGGAGATDPEDDFLLVSDWGATFLDNKPLDKTIPGVVTQEIEYQPGEEWETRAGIGIISTYKDINGTVGFVVYGYNGEDTLWTSTILYTWQIPLFLDDGDGMLEWTDENENGLMDPEDAQWREDIWVPKLGAYVSWWFFGDDLMLGIILPDNDPLGPLWDTTPFDDDPFPSQSGYLKWIFFPEIILMQVENPGVVELVFLIYYDLPVTQYPADAGEYVRFTTDSHPVILIVEELGTISEKPQHPDP